MGVSIMMAANSATAIRLRLTKASPLERAIRAPRRNTRAGLLTRQIARPLEGMSMPAEMKVWKTKRIHKVVTIGTKALTYLTVVSSAAKNAMASTKKTMPR